MVVIFIKDYTRPSGRVSVKGSLTEYDQVTGQQLIDAGYCAPFAVSASDVGCQDMLRKNHLMGMNENIKIYEPDPEQDED